MTMMDLHKRACVTWDQYRPIIVGVVVAAALSALGWLLNDMHTLLQAHDRQIAEHAAEIKGEAADRALLRRRVVADEGKVDNQSASIQFKLDAMTTKLEDIKDSMMLQLNGLRGDVEHIKGRLDVLVPGPARGAAAFQEAVPQKVVN